VLGVLGDDNQMANFISQFWIFSQGWSQRTTPTIVLLLLLAGTVSARPTIIVHNETIAKNDKLTLGDIAEITNTDAPTATLLKNINLGYSPEVGMIRQIAREKISVAVAAAGFADDSVELRSQPFVNVRRVSQTVDLQTIREAVEKATLATLRAHEIHAEFVKLDLPLKVEVRTGEVEVRASANNVRNVFAPFSVSVEIWIDGRITRRFNVPTQIEATAKVAVASADLAEKSRVRTPDYELKTVRLDKDINTYIFDPAQLRGVTLTRAVANGQPITTDCFVPDIVVKPGDVVRIIGESNRFSISLTGEARASGHVGDRIQVKNLQSGTILQAVIIDEGKVSVRF
jgi:flagella basal body P-ring formation protein FlgA